LRARLSNCIARKEAYQKEIGYLATIEQGQKKIKAQEHMAEIGEIVGSVSQELRNPLNFVINFAQVSEDVCDELYAMVQNMDQSISLTVQKLQSNISKVAEYGRSIDQIIKFMLEQTYTDDTRYLANINKITSQTVDMLKATYKSRGDNIPIIKVNQDPNIKPMILSVQIISRVIRNILDNAIYAVSKKFNDLSMAEVEVTVSEENDDIIISIYDNGIGIKEENMGKIFEPFYSDKGNSRNPGLGLSSSKEILTKMQGSISVNSKEGEFSEFKIIIPKPGEKLETT